MKRLDTKSWVTALVSALLPFAVPAESSLGGPGQKSTSAHLMFTIVIPRVLSLEILPIRSTAQTLSIGDETHRVVLLAADRPEAGRHHVIFSGSGRRSIVELAACTRAGAVVNCTVSVL